MCLPWDGSTGCTAAVGGQTACGEGRLCGQGHCAEGRGLTRLLLPAAAAPREQCWCRCRAVRCGAEQSAGSAPLPAQPRAKHRRMTLLISPAQKCSAEGILMDL